jgi:hypothetical protein
MADRGPRVLIQINAATLLAVQCTGMMRNLVILTFSGMLLYSPARAEVLYVRPDNGRRQLSIAGTMKLFAMRSR